MRRCGNRVKIGISACLMGEKVRYDGADKFDPVLVEVLERFLDLVPVCPEVGCGMTVPREAMRLEGDPERPRVMTTESRIDLTERLTGYCRARAAQLERTGLSGFVFKARSPSCGLHGVEVFGDGGPNGEGRGVFAAVLLRRLPLLPVAEEGRLADPARLSAFIERVLACTPIR